jgi:hypothetical protein
MARLRFAGWFPSSGSRKLSVNRFLRKNVKTGLEGPDKAKYQHPGWAKLEYRSGPCLSIEPNDPVERLAASRDPSAVGSWPCVIGASAPMQPWPYGMPSSINPFVVFLGASPGGSPPADDPMHESANAYALPTAGTPHGGLYCRDTRNYWSRVREIGALIIRSHVPTMALSDTHSLLGQLNLGTGQFGAARNVPFEPEYCRWVPDVILDHLRPSYVILLGMLGRLSQSGSGFDPLKRLGIDWRKPERSIPFTSYKAQHLKFRIWTRKRPDDKDIRFVLWPQHPSRAPMTDNTLWVESAREFMVHARLGKNL